MSGSRLVYSHLCTNTWVMQYTLLVSHYFTDVQVELNCQETQQCKGGEE